MNISSAQLLKVSFRFMEHVHAGVVGYALNLPETILSVRSGR